MVSEYRWPLTQVSLYHLTCSTVQHQYREQADIYFQQDEVQEQSTNATKNTRRIHVGTLAMKIKLSTPPPRVRATAKSKVSTLPPPTLSDHFIPLSQSVVDKVEKFVLFVGYPRSGHSIIGSYMDSHHNMIIAHEYPLFRTLYTNSKMSKSKIFNNLYETSFEELQKGWRGSKNVQNKGYSLAVEGQWQATFDELKVIGNKHGGSVVQFYRKYPEVFLYLIKYLEATVKIPIHIIHVVRNPFDMIATQTLYMDTNIPGVKRNASVERKFNKPRLLAEVAEDMLKRAAAAAQMLKQLGLPTLELHNEDLIRDPVHVMKQVCEFVEVKCSKHYLNVCKKSTFSSSSKSRNTVVWPPQLIDSLHNDIKNFTFFRQYSFTD